MTPGRPGSSVRQYPLVTPFEVSCACSASKKLWRICDGNSAQIAGTDFIDN
jgi:hypothetical protein